jgi:hypothetical protein
MRTGRPVAQVFRQYQLPIIAYSSCGSVVESCEDHRFVSSLRERRTSGVPDFILGELLDIGSVAKCPQLRKYSRVKVMVNIADVQDMTMCRAPG